MERSSFTWDINDNLAAAEFNNNEIYDEWFIPSSDGSACLEPFRLHGSNVLADQVLQTQGPTPHYLLGRSQLTKLHPGSVGGPNYPQSANPQLHNQLIVENSAVVDVHTAPSWTPCDTSPDSSSSTRNERVAVADENHKKQDWKNLMPIIHRLYINEEMRWEEVRIIMMLIYHFKATRSQYYFRFGASDHIRKNKTNNSKNGSETMMTKQQRASKPRTRLNRKIKESETLTDKLIEILSRQLPTVSKIASPDICLLQEAILKSIGDMASGLFESEGWTAPNVFSITARDQTTGLSSTWQSIGDQTFGATRLAKMSQLGRAVEKLLSIFREMETTMAAPDPSMLVKFWRMCHYIYDLCLIAKDFRILELFFSHYGKMTLATRRPDVDVFPVVRICATLYQILQKDPSALLDSLRIGYLKSIYSLKLFVGGDHATVLAMWSNYLKTWDPDATMHKLLLENYQVLLRESDRVFGPNSESSLSILHRFAYLAHYTLKDDTLTKGLALDLVQRSSSRLPVGVRLEWCLDTQYFAFGSKALAIVCEVEGLHEEVQKSYSSAIAVLELGDSECQIRAEMLRGELAEYLRKWNGVDMI